MLHDVFKTNEGEIEAERGRLEREIKVFEERIYRLSLKYVDDAIDEGTYKETKKRFEDERNSLISKHANCFSLDKEFNRYVSFSVSLSGNLKKIMLMHHLLSNKRLLVRFSLKKSSLKIILIEPQKLMKFLP